jgi:hypothetical protein
MSSKTNTFEDMVINHFLRGVSQPATSAYVALMTVAPTESTNGTEATGTSYARIAAGFSAPSSGSTSNAALLDWGVVGAGGWGTIVAVGIYDALSGGNLIGYKTITSRVTNAGDEVKINAAALTWAED